MAQGREGRGPDLSFLYFLFCIIESLGHLTNTPNSIFCKSSILENGCALRGVCAHLYCTSVGVCTGVHTRVFMLQPCSPAGSVSLPSDLADFGFPRYNQSRGGSPGVPHIQMKQEDDTETHHPIFNTHTHTHPTWPK